MVLSEMVSDKCLCGSKQASFERVNDLPMLRCECGVLRQNVRMTLSQLADWYEEQYFNGVYYHDYDHDVRVANLRLDQYGLAPGLRVLDVGAGNNAFVDAARARGLDAWGQDLAQQSDGPYTYVGELSSIAFPAQWADVVTMHDVLEHVPDPVALLKEIRRILKPGGRLIVDFPRFWHESGRHHWKKVEHIWMLTTEQLVMLLKEQGFVVRIDSLSTPIESKTVASVTTSTSISNVKILVPPGIGDGYWVLAKLRGFLERKDITLPTVYVHDSGPRRSRELWDRVPFIRSGGYEPIPKSKHWDLAYKIPGNPVQANVHGFTYFMSMNAALDHGYTLDEALPGPTNWHEPLFVSKEERAYEKAFRETYGDYVVCAFWDRGFYKSWLEDFNEHALVNALRLIGTEYKVVIMGAHWDLEGIGPRIASRDPKFVSLVGDTTFTEMMGLIRGACAVFGFPAGNTLLAPHLGVPTVLMWNGHFPHAMWQACVSPDAPYLPMSTHNAKSHAVAVQVMEMAR